jgi:hypothetical protein
MFPGVQLGGSCLHHHVVVVFDDKIVSDLVCSIVVVKP